MPRSRLARFFLGLIGLILLVVVAAAAFAVYRVRRPFPTVDGRLTVAGLQAPVNVYRDEYGVAHIYAQNEADLFFAQGYVHAQDRFWQMEFWRHIAPGRLSEISGAATVENDKFIRTMGWNRIAADTLAYYETDEPELLAILEAYAAGVNAYIAANPDALSLNFDILGLVNEPWEVEPWTPLDTIGWSVVMADDLSGNWRSELRRAALNRELGEAQADLLLPTYDYDRRPVVAPTSVLDLPADTEARRSSGALVDWSRVDTDVIGAMPTAGFALGAAPFAGSNNWVVGGAHTASGLPLLANDPHLGIQMPAIWYEIGLHAPGWEVAGFSFAGVPGVVIGHNARIAWGVTNVGPDVQDLYIEKINPANPDQYEFEGEWREMRLIEEVIKVNGGDDVVLTVRETHHGPIINEIVDGQSDVLALRWTAHEPNRLLKALADINRAANFDEFRTALAYWDVPSQNFVYADVDGNIGYQMPGVVPIRRNGDGRAPVPGWTGEFEWEGWVPYEALPSLFNPPAGYIVTANHAVVDEAYPYFIAREWNNGDRGQRITEMLAAAIAAGPVTAADFAAIQSDSRSLLADSYIPLLAGLSSDDARVQAALERLRGWDHQLRRDSVPAALFEMMRLHLATAVLADDVGADNVDRVGGNVFWHALAATPRAVWWDDQTTAAVETPEDILLRALADTVDWFEANVGDDMNEWTWGRLHQATFISAPVGLSGVAAIEGIVNRGSYPADGGSSAVNANSWSFDNPAAVTGHPSMRMIVDLSDFDAGQAVLPTGQSGHPYHANYDDMMALWLEGQYHATPFSATQVEATAVAHLVLTPPE